MLLFVETIVSSCRASSSFSFPPYKSFSSVLQKFLFKLTNVFFTALLFMLQVLQHMYHALQLMYHVLQLMLQVLQHKI